MTRTAKRSVTWFVVLTACHRCVPEPLHARRNYKSVRIDGVPFVRQRADFCGEACAEMALRKLGKRMDQDFVFNQSQLDPLEGRGCYTKELARALTAIGFRIGPDWQRIAVKSADRELEACFAAMYADLAAGIPSIVCMHFDDRPDTTEHFRLVLGYDAKTDEVIYHDPALADGAYRRMKKAGVHQALAAQVCRRHLDGRAVAIGAGQARSTPRRHRPSIRDSPARDSRPPITPSTSSRSRRSCRSRVDSRSSSSRRSS